MRNITTIEELMNEVESLGLCGLRGASKHDLELLDRGYLDCSLDLFDRRDCDYDEDVETLNGTCAIGINDYMEAEELLKKHEQAMGYAHNHHGTNVVMLINDKHYEYGEDPDEVIFGSNGFGADVIAIVDIK